MACTTCLYKRKHKVGSDTYNKCSITGSIGYRIHCPYYKPRSLFERISLLIEKIKTKTNANGNNR